MAETKSPGDSLLRVSINGLLLAPVISLVLFTYERAVVPNYASVPTRLFLAHFTLLGLILPHIQPFGALRRFLTHWRWFIAGIALALAPNATYWFAMLTARRKDPYWGPITLHSTVLFPLVYALANCTVSDTPKQFSQATVNIVALLSAYPIARSLAGILAAQTRLFNVTNSQILLILSVLSINYGIFQAGFPSMSSKSTSKPTKGQKQKRRPSSFSVSPLWEKLAAIACFNAFLVSMHPKLHAPVLADPMKTLVLPPKPTADGIRVQILSSVQSTSGLIVVGEAMSPPKEEDLEAYDEAGTLHSLRYLRAGHSLLGGVWFGLRAMTLTKEDVPLMDSVGVPLGDSIYAAFVLQEAARLVNSTTKAPENALIIGLGTGIAANAFHRHNLSTSIIEIDPAVYSAARKFFGFPDLDPDNVFLEDARGWAARKHSEIQEGANKEPVLYDIVVHDCFSGGSIPEQLFSVEFLQDLKSVVHPEGVIVVNFAGRAISEASRLILRTLEKTFGGQCKALFDSPTYVSGEQLEEEFMNIVFFCSLSSRPPTFRSAYVDDALGSPIRKHIFATLHLREIDLSLLREGDELDKMNGLPDVITDANNPLGKMQEERALDHWKVMRGVLPDVFWETF